jgi:hypothetical protein
MIVIKEEYVPVSRRATPKNRQRRNIQEAISSHMKKKTCRKWRKEMTISNKNRREKV